MPLHVAIPAHPKETGPLIWRSRFIIYLTHTPLFRDPGSSYILSTPRPLAIPVYHKSYTPSSFREKTFTRSQKYIPRSRKREA